MVEVSLDMENRPQFATVVMVCDAVASKVDKYFPALWSNRTAPSVPSVMKYDTLQESRSDGQRCLQTTAFGSLGQFVRVL